MFESLSIDKKLYPSDPRFGVGPSLIPVNHIQNLLDTGHSLLGTSHRKPAVKNLCRELQDGLRKYFNLPGDYEVVLGNGGATFLFDMIGLGLVEKTSVHYTTGEFSSKWYKAHNKIPWINAVEKDVDYGKGQNPEISSGADMICCTLNETSTGVMITDIPDVDESTILAVDATSGAGQIPLDLSKVDLYFFSPQKVFASEGGFYVCIMSPKAIKRAKKLSSRDTYAPEVMSWNHAIDNSIKNQTYNTPAISTIFFLNEQVKLMNHLGEKKIVQMAQEKARFIYDWASEKDYLSCYIESEEFRSIAVATIDVDEKYSANDLAAKLRSENIVMDIEAYRKLGRNQFRISLFHNITLEDLKKLTTIISYAIEKEEV
jgi:phosphoserine aminotransferase